MTTDAERLARIWYSDYDEFTEPMQRVYDDMARKAIAQGVQLPPVPEPEAEPQERWTVRHEDDRWSVLCLGYPEIKTWNEDVARDIARLLNLNDKYEGGVEAEVERLRLLLEEETIEAKGKAARVKELEAELDDKSNVAHAVVSAWRDRAEKAERELAEARKFHTHTEQDRVTAEAQVERLQAAAVMCVYCGGRGVECREKRAEQGDYCCVDCTHPDPAPDATRPTAEAQAVFDAARERMTNQLTDSPPPRPADAPNCDTCNDTGWNDVDGYNGPCIDGCPVPDATGPTDTIEGVRPVATYTGTMVLDGPTDTATKPEGVALTILRDVASGWHEFLSDEDGECYVCGNSPAHAHHVRPAAPTVTREQVYAVLRSASATPTTITDPDVATDNVMRLLAEQGGEG